MNSTMTVRIRVPRWRVRAALWVIKGYAFACRVMRHAPSRAEEARLLTFTTEFIARGAVARG